MSFFINGTLMNTFSEPAPGTNGYDYNVTVFSAPSLPPGLHNLAIQNGHIDGPKSLMLLDAIVYTSVSHKHISFSRSTDQILSFDDSPQRYKASTPTPVGAIVGGVIGGLAFIVVTILGFLWWKKRKSHHNAQQDSTSTPAVHSTSRYASISPLVLPMTTPAETLPVSDVSGSGYVGEPPAYELYDLGSSSRSGSRTNGSAPPRQGVKRR